VNRAFLKLNSDLRIHSVTLCWAPKTKHFGSLRTMTDMQLRFTQSLGFICRAAGLVSGKSWLHLGILRVKGMVFWCHLCLCTQCSYEGTTFLGCPLPTLYLTTFTYQSHRHFDA